MDRHQLLWQMTAEQFAAFDTHMYLDTHPNDTAAMQIHDNYQSAYMKRKSEYESMYGPINSDRATGGKWDWIKDPWPWEREAN